MITSLSDTDLAAISPLLIILWGALLVLLLECFNEALSKRCSFIVTLITLAAALIAAIYAPVSKNPLITPWMTFDSQARFFTCFFILIGIACAFLAASFFKRNNISNGEYYFLLLSCVFGIILIGASADFLTLVIGLETLSIALYVLCGYMKNWAISREAAVKYFLMGSLAAAFLLYGIALIYGAIGTTRFADLAAGYKGLNTMPETLLFLSGVVFVTLGLAFKATIVPFHLWAPDVYEGATTPVTAFMAVGTKAGAFAALARVFLDALPAFDPIWNQGIALLAYPTLIYANFVALRQKQLRRFFAYSGISHAGFLLIPFAVGGSDALPALLFYLVMYAVATLGCFAVLSYLDHGNEGAMLKDLNGLFKRAPVYAGILTLCLLTLAGIPPTVGFFAKFYLFKIAFQAEYYTLVIVALLTTILSAYYYLRMIAVMYSETPSAALIPLSQWTTAAIGIFCFAVIILISFFPQPLLSFATHW